MKKKELVIVRGGDGLYLRMVGQDDGMWIKDRARATEFDRHKAESGGLIEHVRKCTGMRVTLEPAA